MNDCLDLYGASGATYRFRRVGDPAALPAQGGNFIYAKETGTAVEVIYLGADETLRQARAHWDEAVKEKGAEAIFIRLHITRDQRVAEYEDLVAGRSGKRR